MSHTIATPSVIRFHRQVAGVPGTISGTLDVIPVQDGSCIVWLDVAGQRTQLIIAADETFASVWKRLEATMQASYPMFDPTSESSVAPVPNA